MLDIGWTELAVIAVVALIIIGPRDLPGALHTLGRWIGRARALMREFQSGLDDIARETEMRDLQNRIASPRDLIRDDELERLLDEEDAVTAGSARGAAAGKAAGDDPGADTVQIEEPNAGRDSREKQDPVGSIDEGTDEEKTGPDHRTVDNRP